MLEIKTIAIEKEKKKKQTTTVEINSWLPIVKEEAEVGGQQIIGIKGKMRDFHNDRNILYLDCINV